MKKQMRKGTSKSAKVTTASGGMIASTAPDPARGRLELIDIATIVRDDTTQIRKALDRPTVARYVEFLEAGRRLPAPVVFRGPDGAIRMADGHHTLEAHITRGATHVECEVREGSAHEAWMYAIKVNARHGLPLKNADKVKIVTKFLEVPARRKMSNRKIADALGGAVSYELVRQLKQPTELQNDNGCQPQARRPRTKSPTRRGSDRAAGSPMPGEGPGTIGAAHPTSQQGSDGGRSVAELIDLDRLCEEETGMAFVDGEPVLKTAQNGGLCDLGGEAARSNETETGNDAPNPAPLPGDVPESGREVTNEVLATISNDPNASVAYAVRHKLIAVAVRKAETVTVYYAEILHEAVVDPKLLNRQIADSAA